MTYATGAIPVTVQIFSSGVMTGGEIGWLAFADGWLVYDGLRTRFAFSLDSVADAEVLAFHVVLRLVDGRKLRISYLPDRPSSPTVTRRDDMRLHDEMRAWLSGPISNGHSILPPTRIHPDIFKGRIRRNLSYIAILSSAAIILYALARPLTWIPSALALLYLLGVVVTAHQFKSALKNLSD